MPMRFGSGGLLCAFKGEVERAVEHQQQAERLNPLDAGWTGTMTYPIAYFGVGDHEKVVDWTARMLRERPNSRARFATVRRALHS